jgi:carboxypeptidase Q
MTRHWIALALACASTTAVAASTAEEAAQLRDRALKDNHAWEVVDSLTREVGGRSAGSPGDPKAVAWALRTLKKMGLQNVHEEPVTVPRWVRGEIVGDHPEKLVAVALGGSVGTRGITAPVLMVKDVKELETKSLDEIRGKVVFLDARMDRRADGSGYGENVGNRFLGPAEAGRRGAAAVVIRSIGTSRERIAHTGMMLYDETSPRIPAAALSNDDADLLEQQLRDGVAVQLKIVSSAHDDGNSSSANVMGEIVGQTSEVVLLAAHLDSWDLATGANDDGAGVAIVTEAVRMIGTLGHPPARTVRVVLFANEEHGLSGAKAYAEVHRSEVPQHVLAMEADFGSGAVQQVKSHVGDAGLPAMQQMIDVLAPLGVAGGPNEGHGGSDIGPMNELGVPIIDPRQDGTNYFDIHHTVSDTMEHIDRAGLSQNVAVYAVCAFIAAQHAPGFGRLPVTSADVE